MSDDLLHDRPHETSGRLLRASPVLPDTRPLSERVADILATEDCVVTPLLREQQEEIVKLNCYLCDAERREAALKDDLSIRGNMIRQLEGYIDTFRRDLEAARVDAERLLWVFIDTGIDQIGDIDIHARACEINDGEDEMKDASYLQAIREAVDAARARGEGNADE